MASSTLSLLTFSLLLLFLPPLTSSISDETLTNATDTLSTSGFTAMSLTLSLLSNTLFSDLPSATIFTPSDDSFFLSLSSGQPSLSLLRLHFSSQFYSSADLLSLSSGSQLPTLLPNRTLTLTTENSRISINGVNLTANSPVFDDGFLSIFAIDRFFNPNFTSLGPSPSPSPSSACPGVGPGTLGKPVEALRSRNYSAMAAFLEVQLPSGDFSGEKPAMITVFAPNDDAMEGQFGNYSNWGRVFRRHVVPCELSWENLVGLEDGSILSTFLEGFVINVTLSGDNTLLLNGEITVDFPDFYRDNRVVIHGLSGMLSVPEWLEERESAAHSPAGDWIHHGEF